VQAYLCIVSDLAECVIGHGCATTDWLMFSAASCGSEVATLESFKVDRDIGLSVNGKSLPRDDGSNGSFMLTFVDDVAAFVGVGCELTSRPRCSVSSSDLDTVLSPLHKSTRLHSSATTF